MPAELTQHRVGLGGGADRGENLRPALHGGSRYWRMAGPQRPQFRSMGDQGRIVSG